MPKHPLPNQPQPHPPATPHTNPNSHSKISISFPSHINHYDEEDNNTPVLVYLHAHNRRSLKMCLPANLPLSEINRIVEEQMGIKRDKQRLYLNGKDITTYGNIRLQTNTILHISSTDQICHNNQEITFKLTLLNFIDEKQQKICADSTAIANQKIQHFIARIQKDHAKMFDFSCQDAHFQLLQSSRLLDKDKTFREEGVTVSSALTCILTKNQLKTRFSNDTKEEILNDIQQLLGFGEEEVKTDNKHEQQHASRGYIREESRIHSVNRQETSGNHKETNQQNQLPIANFKKKAVDIANQDETKNSCDKILLTKLKSTRTKKQLDELLKSQKSQCFIQEQHATAKQTAKECAQSSQAPNNTHKPVLLVHNAMPINERRKIKQEMQKLLDVSEQSKQKPTAKDAAQANESKEEKRPISPATQTPRPKQKMRLSMGSRPAFLDRLRSEI